MTSIAIKLIALVATLGFGYLTEYARRRWSALAFLSVTTAFYVSLLAAFGAFFGVTSTAWVERGDRIPLLDRRMEGLRMDVVRQYRQDPNDLRVRICVLGDSTHFFGLQYLETTGVQMRSRFDPRFANEVQWTSAYFVGLAPYEFYFILNLFAEYPPDILVLPVNLRSFGTLWLENPLMTYTEFQRYLLWSEIPRAAQVGNTLHDLRWDKLAADKLDYVVSGSAISKGVRGIKLAYADQLDALETWTIDHSGGVLAAYDYEPKNPYESISEEERERLRIDWDIQPDHDYFGVYRALHRLADRLGVTVVYYPVESTWKGPEPDSQERAYDRIRSELVTADNVVYLDILGLLAPEDYSDPEHPNAAGAVKIAERLDSELVPVVESILARKRAAFEEREGGRQGD